VAAGCTYNAFETKKQEKAPVLSNASTFRVRAVTRGKQEDQGALAADALLQGAGMTRQVFSWRSGYLAPVSWPFVRKTSHLTA